MSRNLVPMVPMWPGQVSNAYSLGMWRHVKHGRDKYKSNHFFNCPTDWFSFYIKIELFIKYWWKAYHHLWMFSALICFYHYAYIEQSFWFLSDRIAYAARNKISFFNGVFPSFFFCLAFFSLRMGCPRALKFCMWF